MTFRSWWRSATTCLFFAAAALAPRAEAACCSSYPTQQITKTYYVNASALQSALQIGSSDPTRSIQVSMAALQWSAGSKIKYVYGGTTAAMDCNAIPAGTTVITGNSGCGPFGCSNFSPGWGTCVANGNAQQIILYRGTGFTWKTTPVNNTQLAIDSVVFGAAMRLAGAAATGANCLSSNTVTADSLLRFRNQACNEEIQQIAAANQGSTGSGQYTPATRRLYQTGTTPGYNWVDPNEDWIGGGAFGLDAALGHYVGKFGVIYPRSITVGLSMSNGTGPGQVWVRLNGVDYNTGLTSWRRPTIVFDPVAVRWLLFVHDPAYQDRVRWYYSGNGVNYLGGAFVGTAIGNVTGCTAPRAVTPIHTRWPVAAAYDRHANRVMVAWVTTDGTTNTEFDTWWVYGQDVAGSIDLTRVMGNGTSQDNDSFCDAYAPIRRQCADPSKCDTSGSTHARTMIVTHPPTLACSMVDCFSSPSVPHVPQEDCVVVSTGAGTDDRNLVSASVYISLLGLPSQSIPQGWASDYDGTNWNQTGWTDPPNHPFGASDYPPTFAAAGSANGWPYTGKYVLIVRGTDGLMYQNTLASPRFTWGYGVSCASVTSANFDGWTGSLLNNNALWPQWAPRVTYGEWLNRWDHWFPLGNQ